VAVVAPEEESDDEPLRPIRRRRPPPLPEAPSLWRGTYSFPWHLGNLRAWILFGLGWTLTVLIAAWVWHLTLMYREASEVGRNIFFRVLILSWKGFVAFFLWTGMYAGGYFLATVQDTAAGRDKTDWPEDSLGEKLLTLLYLLWIVFCAAIPAGPVAMGLRYALETRGLEVGLTPLLVLIVPWVLVLTFPWIFLAALATDSAVLFWHGGLFRSLLRRPGLLLALYLASVSLVIPCQALGLLTVFALQYYLGPLTGFGCAAALLIYGRFLGRVGGIVSEQHLVGARRPGRRG
jgi:hypothetical protein